MTYDEEAKDMTSEAAYIPKKEDFVPAPASMRKAVSAEAVRGVKYETLKRFIANKSGVAGVIILMILILLALAGPYLTGHSYDKQDLTRSDLAPRIPVLSSFGILDGSERMDKTSGALVRNKYEELGSLPSEAILGHWVRELYPHIGENWYVNVKSAACDGTPVEYDYVDELSGKRYHFSARQIIQADYCAVTYVEA